MSGAPDACDSGLVNCQGVYDAGELLAYVCGEGWGGGADTAGLSAAATVAANDLLII